MLKSNLNIVLFLLFCLAVSITAQTYTLVCVDDAGQIPAEGEAWTGTTTACDDHTTFRNDVCNPNRQYVCLEDALTVAPIASCNTEHALRLQDQFCTLTCGPAGSSTLEVCQTYLKNNGFDSIETFEFGVLNNFSPTLSDSLVNVADPDTLVVDYELFTKKADYSSYRPVDSSGRVTQCKGGTKQVATECIKNPTTTQFTDLGCSIMVSIFNLNDCISNDMTICFDPQFDSTRDPNSNTWYTTCSDTTYQRIATKKLCSKSAAFTRSIGCITRYSLDNFPNTTMFQSIAKDETQQCAGSPVQVPDVVIPQLSGCVPVPACDINDETGKCASKCANTCSPTTFKIGCNYLYQNAGYEFVDASCDGSASTDSSCANMCTMKCAPTAPSDWSTITAANTCDATNNFTPLSTCGNYNTRAATMISSTGVSVTCDSNKCTPKMITDLSTASKQLPSGVQITAKCQPLYKCSLTQSTTDSDFNQSCTAICDEFECGVALNSRLFVTTSSGQVSFTAFQQLNTDPAYHALITGNIEEPEPCPCPGPVILCAIDTLPTDPDEWTRDQFEECPSLQCGAEKCVQGTTINDVIKRDLYCLAENDYTQITDAASLDASPCKDLAGKPDFSKTCDRIDCVIQYTCTTTPWPVRDDEDDTTWKTIVETFMDEHDCTDAPYSDNCSEYSSITGTFTPATCPAIEDMVTTYHSRVANCIVYKKNEYTIVQDDEFSATCNTPNRVECIADDGCPATTIEVAVVNPDKLNTATGVNFNFVLNGSFFDIVVEAVPIGDSITDAKDGSIIWIPIGTIINIDGNNNSATSLSLNSLHLTEDSNIFFRFSYNIGPTKFIFYPTDSTGNENSTQKFPVTYIATCATIPQCPQYQQCQEASIDGDVINHAKCVCTDPNAVFEDGCKPIEPECQIECPVKRGKGAEGVCGCSTCLLGWTGNTCQNCQIWVGIKHEKVSQALFDNFFKSDEFFTKVRNYLSTTLPWESTNIVNFPTRSAGYDSKTQSFVLVLALSGTCPSISAFERLAIEPTSAAKTLFTQNFQSSTYSTATLESNNEVIVTSLGVYDPFVDCSTETCPDSTWFQRSDADIVTCVDNPDYPGCQKASENPDDNGVSTTTVVLAVVIPIAAVLIIILAIVLLCLFCTGDNTSSSSPPQNEHQEQPKAKKANKRGSTVSDHLELT